MQPFAYSTTEFKINLTEPGTININESTTNIYPYYKIEGSGKVTITINNKSQIIYNVDEYIELDAEIEEAYKDNENQNSNVLGEFLTLQQGNNVIEWIGNVTNFQIKYRETFL